MAIKYKKFTPTQYVMKVKNGRVTAQGLGLSFLYDTMKSGILVLPATSLDSPFIFNDIMTADFQSVNIQGDIAYIISNYERAAKVFDFSYKDSPKDRDFELTQAAAKVYMTKRITNMANILAAKFMAGKDIRQAVKSAEELAAYLSENMENDKTAAKYGLEIISVSILSISASAETRRALEASAREEILKQQDDAIYKRRNSAIEQERLVKENELNTEIKIAEKEKQKREKEMETKYLVQEKQSELDSIKMNNDITLEKRRAELVDMETENERKRSDAKAYDSEVLLNAFKNVDAELIKALVLTGMDSKALIAKAFVEIGDKADKIGTLSISPDLLETLTEK